MIKKIMITFICVFMLPIIVNADMGAPEITSYEVLVTNTNGAQAYDYDGNKLNKVFDFNENLTIIMEISIDGMIYLGVDYEDGDNNSYYINEQDVSIDGDVNFDKFYKKEGKLYVFDEGAVLYKGPSIKYGVIEDSNIPIGTTLTYEYSDELWAYVEYNGKKGWIYKYSFEGFSQYEDLKSSVCSVAESKHITLKDEIEIYEKPDLDSNKQKISIPRNTIVTGDKTFVRYPKSSFEYIKYGEYEGWIYIEEDSDTFGYKGYNYDNQPYKTMTVDSLNLTEFIGSEESILVIPKGERITLDTYYVYDQNSYNDTDFDMYYYIEYNGKKGWVNSDKFAYYQKEGLLTLKDIDLLKDYNNQEVLYNLKQYEEIKDYYRYDDYSNNESYYYIQKDDVKGWVKYKENTFAYSSTCSQFLVLEKKGTTLKTLLGEEKSIPYYAILTELYFYYESNERNLIVDYKGEKYILGSGISLAGTPSISRYRFNDKENTNLTLKVYDNEEYVLQKMYQGDPFEFEIPNGEEFDVLFEQIYSGLEEDTVYSYINYKGKKGWIILDKDKLETVEVERKNCLINENLEVEYKDTKPSSTWNPNKYVNSKLIIVTCVIVAIAISLTAVVTILTFNSKRKLKKIQHKDEVSEVQKNEER